MSKRALIFAGQGAQFVGMGRDLADAYPECRDLYTRADEVLGYDLSRTCFEGPAEALNRSDLCQPAIFVTSVACYQALKLREGLLPFDAAAGLSLGEWTALHVAGALSFEDTLRVLEARGRFMQQACSEREGGMVCVIGLLPEQLRSICERAGVEMANLNSEKQTVLSGEKQRMAEAERLAQEAGAARTLMLTVAGAYHSSLMASAAEHLRGVLADARISAPRVPVIANVTGLPHGSPDEIRETMVKQVTSAVQWVACVKWMAQNGVSSFIEFGPGKVLAGLIKQIDKAMKGHSIQDCHSLAKAFDHGKA